MTGRIEQTTPPGSELMPRCTGDAYRDLRESLKVALKEAEIHKHVTLHIISDTPSLHKSSWLE